MVRLLEFARNREDIKRNLIYVTPKIVEHLLKLAIDPNNSARNHWIQEIYSFLNDIDILKTNKRLPKADFIYTNSFGNMIDRVNTDRFIRAKAESICEIENIKTNKTVTQLRVELTIVCEEYFKWLSNELSEYGIVSHSQVRNKIDEILSSY